MVRDDNGQKLAYEARRIAANVAKIPDLTKNPPVAGACINLVHSLSVPRAYEESSQRTWLGAASTDVAALT